MTQIQPCAEDNRTFFEKFQTADGLDLRGKQGKEHDVAVVLMGVILAILSNRDGNLSSLHRHIENHYAVLWQELQLNNYNCKVVSR